MILYEIFIQILKELVYTKQLIINTLQKEECNIFIKHIILTYNFVLSSDMYY
jgi:hypothetical protein